MPEPLTIGITLASFLGGFLAKSAESFATETTATKIGSLLCSEGLARAAGHFGLATNHDAEKEIRRAQMAALKHLLNRYEANVPTSDEQGAPPWPQAFISTALAFASEATVRCDGETLDLKDNVISALERSLDSALSGVRTASLADRAMALRKAAESAVFNELESEVGKHTDDGELLSIPPGFEALFYKGGADHEGPEIPGWYDAFILFAADKLKGSAPKFEKIFVATRLAQVSELSLDTNEVVRATQILTTEMGKLLAANTHRLVSIQDVTTSIKSNIDLVKQDTEEIRKGQAKIDILLGLIQCDCN